MNYKNTAGIFLSTMGLVISYLLYTGWCPGSGCEKPLVIFNIPVSVLGIFFYATCIVLIFARKEILTRIVLFIGFLCHLIFLLLMNKLCVGCILAAVITTVMLALTLNSKKKIFFPVCAVVVVFLVSGIVTLSVSSKAEVPQTDYSNYGIQVNQEKTTYPGYKIKAKKPNGEVVKLNLKDKPVLYFGWWCSHCKEPLMMISKFDKDKMPYLVSIYIGDDKSKNKKMTREKLESAGITKKVYHKYELKTDAVPALILWKNGKKVTYTGSKDIIELFDNL